MNRRIPIIDGLRGIAILGVVWHHLYAPFTPPGFVSWGAKEFPFLPLSFLSNGWLGVNLFFVLSGFVLFYPYVTARRTMESNQDWWSYYRHRALRLLPLYFVSVIYGFLVIAPPQSTAQWVRDGSLMLTATFGFTKDLWYPQYNWVLWSLGIELWFSVLFPFLVALTRKLTAPRTLVVAAVLAVAARYLGLHEIFQLRGSVYLGPLRDSLLGRLDDFVLGMFIAWLWLKAPRGRSQTWTKAWVAAAGLILIFGAGHLWDDVALGVLPVRVIPLISPVLLSGIFLLMMHLLNAENVLVKTLSLRIFTQPGVMCYSIYIWHGVLRKQILGSGRDPGKVVLYLAVLAVVSFLSYRFIEMNPWFRPSRAGQTPAETTELASPALPGSRAARRSRKRT